MSEQTIQNDLEKKINELEKKLNDLILAKPAEQEPQKKNKTPQYIIDANKRYYQKKKNNLDFKIKIRDRNRKAREKTKGLITTTTTTSIGISTQANNDPIIKKVTNPITISFYDDDDIGF
jgi:hypothetical protein